MNLGEELLESSGKVISPIFTLSDETQWQFSFVPKVVLVNENISN